MKKERLFEALSDIDADLIEEAARPARSPWLPVLRTAGAVAAVLVVAVGVGVFLRTGFSMGNGAPDYSGKAEAVVKDQASAEGDFNYSAEEPTDDGAGAPDIAPADPLTQLTFYLYREGEWRKESVYFRDGVPASRELANEYLTRAGAGITCVDVKITKTEGKETEWAGVVTYIPPHRTATVILSAAPEGGMDVFDGLLRGLILSIHPAVGADLYKLETDEGVPMYFGLSQPLGGYDPDTLWPEGIRE